MITKTLNLRLLLWLLAVALASGGMAYAQYCYLNYAHNHPPDRRPRSVDVTRG
jgi:hypothetical protein